MDFRRTRTRLRLADREGRLPGGLLSIFEASNDLSRSGERHKLIIAKKIQLCRG